MLPLATANGLQAFYQAFASRTKTGSRCCLASCRRCARMLLEARHAPRPRWKRRPDPRASVDPAACCREDIAASEGAFCRAHQAEAGADRRRRAAGELRHRFGDDHAAQPWAGGGVWRAVEDAVLRVPDAGGGGGVSGGGAWRRPAPGGRAGRIAAGRQRAASKPADRVRSSDGRCRSRCQGAGGGAARAMVLPAKSASRSRSSG